MMMQGLRRAGQTWLGKLIVGILFGLLILSFAVWGIADIFRGYGRSTAASVGSTEIGVEQLRFAYQNELQRLMRQTRGQITPETARQLRLDQIVLSRLVADAAIDERVRQLGLGVSDDTIADAIRSNPAFRGPDGQFNRGAFDAVLRDNNTNEARFLADQRKGLLREHLQEGLVGGIAAPTALKEAMHRFANETRSVEYVIVPAEGLTAGAPDETALQKFFDERKSAFRAPEFRTIIALALTPNALAKPDAISDADARKRYEEIKTTRFGAPERRAVRQMRFATVDEAKAASERIKAGTSFEAVAAERNIAEKDLDMGRLTRREMIDAAVADAAFALEKDAISEPVNGQFGPVLVKVVDVEPEYVRPFEEVAAEVKLELARAAAQNAIRDTYNKIEDQRASAKPLGEIAQGLGLAAQTFDGVDAQG
ncbi:MAG: SurA N-terminal domain-containing protein, partial [Beijerinckiaceae bacterium]